MGGKEGRIQMTDIVRREPQTLAIPDQIRYAEYITNGNMVPQAYRGNPANAVIAIGLGEAMGLSPAESLYRIDVIQGKPTASAELIASNVRKAGHKLRVRVDERAMSVTATIVRADDPDYEHTVVRDMTWAKTMGLDSKDNYKKQPLTMLQWRAITAVARLACSEALYGVQYSGDELEDMGETSGTPAPKPATAASRLLPPSPQPPAEAPVEAVMADDNGEVLDEPQEPAQHASEAQIKLLRDAMARAGHTTPRAMGAAIADKLGTAKAPHELTPSEADWLIQAFEEEANGE